MRAYLLIAFVLCSGCGDDGTLTIPDASMNRSDLAAPSDMPMGEPDLSIEPSDGAAITDGGGDGGGDDGHVVAENFCNLPGSYQYTANGVVVTPGGAANAPSLAFLKLPPGFCAHWFATVGNARQLRFAPGGELMVASPTRGTTGGGANGQNAIVLLADDNHDGLADAPITFIANISATQGMAFIGDHFYYQDNTVINRIPYTVGDRAPQGPVEQVADIQIYVSGLHWPKPLDVADDGTIYVGNGGDQGETCDPTLTEPERPFHGGILSLDGSDGGTPVAKGFRNPIALRCARGHDHCFALELSLDYSTSQGGREKLIPIHKGDDWGYPCCATKNLAYSDIMPVPDCSAVQAESGSFVIGDTPFGLDFEVGNWPAPWTGRTIVALHGAFGTWTGTRVVAISMDPTTGLPLPNEDANGKPTNAMSDFATGWDDNTLSHGRPAEVAFAADGRLFIANDFNGEIFWVAPIAP